MAVRKILDSDKLHSGFRDKYNETVDQIPTGFTDNGDGTGTLQNGAGGIDIEITGTLAANIREDSQHRFVTDAQKAAWSGNGSVEVVDNHTALLALTGMVAGNKCYVKDDDGAGNRQSYWWDGTAWLVDPDPNWANLNLNWNNITNKPTHTPAQIDAGINAVGNKVDKVTGKQLSTEDYSTLEKQKLASLQNYDDTALAAGMGNKVDKIIGKGLSEQDYTIAEKQKLTSLQNYDDTALAAGMGNKVDKVQGEGLTPAKFTQGEKDKLANLINVNPANFDVAGTAASQVAAVKDNVPTAGDTLRKQYLLIQALQALVSSNDLNLDTLQEIVAFIKENKIEIDSIGTGKVNILDIIDNLLSTADNRPLSANQGKVLKDLINALTAAIPTLLSQLTPDATHRIVTDTEKNTWNGKSNFSGSYTDLSNKPPIPSADNSVKRGFSFNDSATLGADYYPNATSITAITARNIQTLEFSTDGINYTTLILPAGLPFAVGIGDLYWRITYSAGKTQAFLDITGIKS